ncbi:MAG: DUF2520 domain-containing protein [Chlorobiota bacterium]|nr:MAG: DUF2520 domain-containing protein [Chlorobiota bacterium]
MSSLESLQIAPSVGALPFRIGIVGGGRVGGAIARALAPNVAWIVARSPQRRWQLRRWLEWTPIVGTLEEIAVLPQALILAVPDSALASIAVDLARRFGRQLEGVLVVHCSGVLTRSAIAPVESFGGNAAAAHPFTMIPEPDPMWLYGAAWGVEATEVAREQIEHLISALGGIPYWLGEVCPQRKALYHLAAVLASNVTTAAIAAALRAARAAAIPAELFLPPILRATIESAIASLRQGTTIARTGPLERGDVETIERHLAALEVYPSLQQQYCAFLRAMLSERDHGPRALALLLHRYCSAFGAEVFHR